LFVPIAAANSGTPETLAARIAATSNGVLRMVPPVWLLSSVVFAEF
jgi:hypothetical protein